MRDQPAHRVLIAGGGVAALETLLALRAAAGGDVALTLLAPEPAFTYRPLAVVAPFARDGVPALALAEVAADRGAELIAGALAAVEPDARVAIARDGTRIAYDELVIAVGARAEPAVAGATTFAGPQDAPAVAAIVDGVRSGAVRRVALIAPAGVPWTLPLYELALQLARERAPDGRPPELLLVCAEREPLVALGRESAAAARELLDARGVQLRTSSVVEAVEDGTLWIELEGGVEVDAAIALPRLLGPAIAGLPQDADGFIPVDAFGRVRGEDHVYAAGDVCAQRLKQGGLAAQQADTVAACIAHAIGAGPRPGSPAPVLRTVLLTGGRPRYLRAAVARGGEEHDGDEVAEDALWWPPAKIAARHLGPYLAERLLRA
jgi:sulfide:quinone oxidoreductase